MPGNVCVLLSMLLSRFSLLASRSVSLCLCTTPPPSPDDGALRIWKNFADQKNPEMVTAWQGLSDMLPTTRGQPSSSAHSKDQRSILLSAPPPSTHPYSTSCSNSPTHLLFTPSQSHFHTASPTEQPGRIGACYVFLSFIIFIETSSLKSLTFNCRSFYEKKVIKVLNGFQVKSKNFGTLSPRAYVSYLVLWANNFF